MAYSGPTPVSSLSLLLSAIVSFAVTHCGFTDEGTVAGPAGASTPMYRISKGGLYWYFVGMTQTINGQTAGYILTRIQNILPTATNYATTAYGPQYPTKIGLFFNPSGPYTYYNLFSDGKSVFLALEVFPGVFTHLAFGTITKFGTWTGGEYVTGSHCENWRTSAPIGFEVSSHSSMFDIGQGGYYTSGYGGHIRNARNSYGDMRDYAYFGQGVVNNQRAFSGVSVTAARLRTYQFYNFPMGRLMQVGANGFNGRTVLFPMYVFLYDSTTGGIYPAGYVDNICPINMTFVNAKDIVESVWECFPVHQKNGSTTIAPISDFMGVAYKRIS